MRSYGPKSLLALGDGRTVLRRQIDLSRAAFPGSDVCVVVGYESERVIRSLPAGVRSVENELYDDTSVVRSILLALRASTASRALIVYGDLVFDPTLLGGLSQLAPEESAAIIDNRGKLPKHEIGATIDKATGRVAHFNFGLPNKWCHIALLAGRELSLFRSIAARTDRQNLLAWEVLNEVLERGGELSAIDSNGSPSLIIDTSKDIERAREMTR